MRFAINFDEKTKSTQLHTRNHIKVCDQFGIILSSI